MSEADLGARRQELVTLTGQLNEVLARGLVMRLKDPSWYLTGVKVGLESLRGFYVISELVYREHTANSEGGRRLANMRRVYDKLSEFAGQDQTIQTRTKIMLEILQPLQLLMREWQGQGVLSARAKREQRKTIVGQLAADINLNLIRLRSFEKMLETLRSLAHPKYIILRAEKKRVIDHFHWQYIGYSKIFGFDDPIVLHDKTYVQELTKAIVEEIKLLEQTAGQIWASIYRGRFKERATMDYHTDLAEPNLLPILKEIAQAGFDYLDRAYTAYGHALEMAGSDDKLLIRVGELGAELAESELRVPRGTVASAA